MYPPIGLLLAGVAAGGEAAPSKEQCEAELHRLHFRAVFKVEVEDEGIPFVFFNDDDEQLGIYTIPLAVNYLRSGLYACRYSDSTGLDSYAAEGLQDNAPRFSPDDFDDLVRRGWATLVAGNWHNREDN